MTHTKASYGTVRVICIVDDDASVREALEGLLRSAGFRVEVFRSAAEFLRSARVSDAACLILDVRMPGMGGLELQEELVGSNRTVPIIFITAHGDADARGHALERGAIGFLQKPFNDDALLDAIGAALAASPIG
jgi:FixJ family two-component response regulator